MLIPDILNNRLLHLANNFTTLRESSLRRLFENDALDIDKECHYPDELTVLQLYDYYSRNGIAARIVSLYPNECWQMPPEIYETERTDIVTEFESAWNAINKRLSLLSKLETLDRLCGIGRYGVLLLGFDDGLDLSSPVPGAEGTARSHKPLNLLYVRPFAEVHAEIKAIDNNRSSPRYGHPVLYELKVLGESDNGQLPSSSIASITSSVLVHWTRMIHVADNQESSEVFGTPRLQQVFNDVFNMKKILGSSAEGYYKGGFPGLSLETHPTLDAIEFTEEDKEKTKQEIEKYQLGLQRYLATIGMTVKPLTPQIADPSSHIRSQLMAISIAMGVPFRIFLGSEEGKLASSQDMRTWNKRLAKRQKMFIDQFIIRPFLDRLINVGVLPKVKEYFIRWPDLNAPTENDRAITAQKITDAMVKYVSGKVFMLMRPREYLVNVLGYSISFVDIVIKAAGGEDQLLDKLMQINVEMSERPAKQEGIDEGAGPP